jgi:hypothetical protein
MMKDEGLLFTIRKHIYESAEILSDVLNELDDVIKTQYLEVVQEAENTLSSVTSSTLFEPCRYTREEIWNSGTVWQKALDEIVSDKWSIGDSYFLDLPVQGFVLLRFYEICLDAIKFGKEQDIGKIFSIDRYVQKFMVYFGMMIGDGGKTVKMEIEKIQKRQSIIDTKVRKNWMDLICWIEEHHTQGKYDDIKSFNALAEIIKAQIEVADRSKIYNHSKKTIIRCLKQVFQLKPQQPFSLPQKLKRNIDYNI